MQLTTLPARLAVFAAGLALIVSIGVFPATADDPPTPEEYVAYVGGDARILPAGGLKLDGDTQRCGKRRTVLDPNLDDYGAAYPGFLIMNPKLLARVSTPVKKWIYAHECGHQFRGPDEETADLRKPGMFEKQLSALRRMVEDSYGLDATKKWIHGAIETLRSRR